jgi:hypothetical protein
VRRVKFEGERSGKIDSRMKAMAASSSSSGQRFASSHTARLKTGSFIRARWRLRSDAARYGAKRCPLEEDDAAIAFIRESILPLLSPSNLTLLTRFVHSSQMALEE